MKKTLITEHAREARLLILLVLPFIYMFFQPMDLQWIGYFVLFLLLGICYYFGIVNPQKRRLFIAFQYLIVAVMGTLYSPLSLFLGFYPALIAGMLKSYRQITQMVVTMVVLFAAAIFFFREAMVSEWLPYLIPALLALIVIPYVSKLFQRSFEMSVQLEGANAEIARLIKNEERQRIARDLHDTLGHTLSMITVKSELVERLIPDHPDQALVESREVQTISRSVLLQVRELVSDMQSIDISEEFERAEEILQSAGIKFIWKKSETVDAPPTIRFILGMCIRECVTNVVKHSNAKTCTVELKGKPDEFVLSVQDDGTGLEQHDRSGNGLLGMKERLLLIEGKLDYESSRSDGTKVIITVPKS